MAESKSAALPLGYAPMPRDACLQNRAGPHRIAAAIAPGNESLRGPAGLVPERRAKATGFSAQACPAAVSALRLFTGGDQLREAGNAEGPSLIAPLHTTG
jgi:hypothetical protein